MPTLSSAIRNYYFDHFDSLSKDKQFHYISRLSSWDADARAVELLVTLRSEFVTDTIKDDLRELLHNPPAAKINAATRRAPYFAAYPTLRGTMLALFRVRHLLFHYDVDAREILLELIPKEELYALSDALMKDKEAIAVLSTYAINTIYLIESILYPRKDSPLPDFIETVMKIGAAYNNTKEDLLLLVYLYTHCIIGASNFYQSSVKSGNYTLMLKELDEKISLHFSDINLDNKCEFLVCCQIAGFQSQREKRINDEAANSISSEGTFIVDRYNTAGQQDKISFSDSEHRNVLYIMSQSEFQR